MNWVSPGCILEYRRLNVSKNPQQSLIHDTDYLQCCFYPFSVYFYLYLALTCLENCLATNRCSHSFQIMWQSELSTLLAQPTLHIQREWGGGTSQIKKAILSNNWNGLRKSVQCQAVRNLQTSSETRKESFTHYLTEPRTTYYNLNLIQRAREM